MAKRDFLPIHLGEILLEDFLKPMNISQYAIAKSISVPPRRINEIVQGKRSITPDTALRLGRFFQMEAQFWLNLQSRYDLEVTKEILADRLNQEVHILQASQNIRS
jgi:antitoxin HigA-1